MDVTWGLILTLVLGIFILVFVRTELGLCLVLLSMLLSPEFTLGGVGRLAEKREVVLRSEDLLLLVIAFSWFAKTAVNKELGLVLRTPLNRPIVAYVVVTFLATLIGYLAGSVQTVAGFFYVLKYVEYFVVFFMVVNNLRDREQAWRLARVAFLTAALVSLIGIAQIPSGARVSAPFEGDAGEPNTFGGYLLFMMAVALAVALETPRLATRVWALGLSALMSAPFLFTLSRASYLGLLPMLGTLVWLTTRRRAALVALVLALALVPLALATTPTAVQERVAETFRPQADQPRVQIGRIAFDPSTSERLLGYRDALRVWLERPVLGRGVTGGFFLDAQYPRTLMESGLAGLAALAWLVWATLRSGLSSLRAAATPEDRGLALGFVAGLIGLLFHAVGSNTFIIIRIMEPFWFFAGIIVMLPGLRAEPAAPAASGRRAGVRRIAPLPAGRL